VTGAGRRRLRQRLLIVFLIAMTIPYARQLVSSPTVGQDFRAFFAAATVVAHHGDPYDWPSLARVEDQLYDGPGQLAPGNPAFYEFLAYPEGPWLAFALVPLTGLPWQAADAIYTSLLLLVLVGASFTVFALLGWRPARAWLGAACAALSAVGFINLFMGQVSVIVFGAFVAAWYLAGRGHGNWLFAQTLALAWRSGVERVRVNTCTLDHPAALPAYLKAGFRAVKRAFESFPDPRLAGLLPTHVAPQVPLLEHLRH